MREGGIFQKKSKNYVYTYLYLYKINEKRTVAYT